MVDVGYNLLMQKTKLLIDLENNSIEKLKEKIISLYLKIYNERDIKEKEKIKLEIEETIVNYILKNNKVYTIREDKKDPEMFIYKNGIYVPEARTYIKETCQYCLEKAYSSFFCNKIINKIEVKNYIKKEDFFKVKDEYIIPVQNGLLNLKTKKLNDFSPDYIFTNKLPLFYDENCKCENIVKFFNDVLKHAETDLIVMQEWVGYCLVKNYNFQYATMFLGNGRNGKGVALDIIKNLLGCENISSLTLQKMEKERFCLCDLYNKYANISGDLSKTALKETGYFKQLTGQDTITVDRKFLSMITFINYAKMMFATNDLPYSYDDSDGFYDRWIIFDFPYKFVDEIKNPKFEKIRDPNIKNKLINPEEMSGFLNWAIEGLHRLLKNKCFSYNQTSADNRKKWKRQASSFNGFFEDHCKIDFSQYTTVEILKLNYQKYCEIHKLKFDSNLVIKNVLEANGCDYTTKRESFGNDSYTTRAWSGLIVTNVTR